jgi:hypothetical protein
VEKFLVKNGTKKMVSPSTVIKTRVVVSFCAPSQNFNWLCVRRAAHAVMRFSSIRIIRFDFCSTLCFVRAAMEKKEISHFAPRAVAAANNEIKKAPRAKLNCSWEYMFADGTKTIFHSRRALWQ